ncbi:MAG: ATP-binding domain-containing protein [Gemmatimonadota bacterium]|nr:ATP-binding domain-containing protein [Gemmatimonadota bacterium]
MIDASCPSLLVEKLPSQDLSTVPCGHLPQPGSQSVYPNPRCAEDEAEAPQFWPVAAESLVKATRRTLHRIINEDAVPPGEVAILTVRKAEDSILAREDKLGNFRLHIGRPGSRRAPGKISLYSIHRFKGLESDVVLLIVEEPGHKPRQPLNDLIYIGASRARGHLVLLGREATLHRLHEGAAAGVE